MTDDKLIAAIDASFDALKRNPKSHWIVAYSGGKDSTATLKIILAARRKLRMTPPKLTVIYCDTGVENPILDAYVKSTFDRLEQEWKSSNSDIRTKILRAPVQDRFFVRIVGRGYPPPTNSFRWCTNGLRIRPVSRFIESQDPNDTIVALGVRRDESQQRDRTLSGQSGWWQKQREGRKDYDLFLPVINLNLSEVWDAIYWLDEPHAIRAAELEELYRGASGECPVLRSPIAPPCASGRFGCWTCTVVRKDKSAQKLIEAGHERLRPFLEFRNWLAEFRNRENKRWPRRRNGRPGLGPFTIEARKEILRRIEVLEGQTGTSILAPDEREAIERLWRLDHLPRIPFKGTGAEDAVPRWLQSSRADAAETDRS